MKWTPAPKAMTPPIAKVVVKPAAKVTADVVVPPKHAAEGATKPVVGTVTAPSPAKLAKPSSTSETDASGSAQQKRKGGS